MKRQLEAAAAAAAAGAAAADSLIFSRSLATILPLDRNLHILKRNTLFKGNGLANGEAMIRPLASGSKKTDLDLQ